MLMLSACVSRHVSRHDAIRTAEDMGHRLNIPIHDRSPTVTEDGAHYIVTYSKSYEVKGTNRLWQAGDWVFTVDKNTGKLLDAKIWR
jgi:hypothetical protein